MPNVRLPMTWRIFGLWGSSLNFPGHNNTRLLLRLFFFPEAGGMGSQLVSWIDTLYSFVITAALFISFVRHINVVRQRSAEPELTGSLQETNGFHSNLESVFIREGISVVYFPTVSQLATGGGGLKNLCSFDNKWVRLFLVLCHVNRWSTARYSWCSEIPVW